MKTCKKCGKQFDCYIEVNGKRKGLYNRKFCLECSPYGEHNTKNLVYHSKTEKKCSNCQKVLPNSDFYCKNNKVYFSYCKKCAKIVFAEKQREQKIKSIEYLGGKCSRCGYNKCIWALEFHHTNPQNKDPTIRFSSTRQSFYKIKRELDKCIILCANCHREEHERIKNTNLT
jgi:hypothetical protein